MSDQTELLRLLRLAWVTDHVSAEDCKKIDTLLAAPPEDVRAVVDEPVAWMSECIRGYRKGMIEQTDGPGSTHNIEYWTPDFPVYRRPQRPFVMPDFNEWYAKNIGVLGTGPAFHDKRTWQACLDEIARLNPEISK